METIQDSAIIKVTTINGISLINISDIAYITGGNSGYTDIYLDNGKRIMAYKPLGNYEQLHGLKRVSKCYVINTKKNIEIMGNTVTIGAVKTKMGWRQLAKLKKIAIAFSLMLMSFFASAQQDTIQALIYDNGYIWLQNDTIFHRNSINGEFTYAILPNYNPIYIGDSTKEVSIKVEGYNIKGVLNKKSIDTSHIANIATFFPVNNDNDDKNELQKLVIKQTYSGVAIGITRGKDSQDTVMENFTEGDDAFMFLPKEGDKGIIIANHPNGTQGLYTNKDSVWWLMIAPYINADGNVVNGGKIRLQDSDLIKLRYTDDAVSPPYFPNLQFVGVPQTILRTGDNVVLSNTGGSFSLSDKANSAHLHSIVDVNGLLGALGAKSDTSHLHNVSQVTGLQDSLNTRSRVGHGHVINDVAFLQDNLNLKSNVNHTHTKADVGLSNVDNTSDLLKPVSIFQQGALDLKANIGHNHVVSNVQGLQDSLNKKANIADTSKWIQIGNNLYNKTLSGNVGIGTTTPTTKLEVLGQISNTQSNTGFGYISSNSSSSSPSTSWRFGKSWNGNYDNVFGFAYGNNDMKAYIDTDGSITTFKSYLFNLASNTTVNAIRPIQHGNSGVQFTSPIGGGLTGNNINIQGWDNASITATTSDVILASGGSEKVRLKNNGNLGIGTSTPSAKLHLVDGDYYQTWANNNPRFLFGSSLSVKNYGGVQWNYNANADLGTLAIGASDLNGLINTMYLTPAGNVGIGTSTPEVITNTRTFTVNGSGVGGGAVSYQVGGVKMGVVNGNDNYFTLQSYNSRPLSLGYNNNNTIVVNTSNNVGIGTTTPATKLDVVGDITATTSTAFPFTLNSSNNTRSVLQINNTNGGDPMMLFSQNGTARWALGYEENGSTYDFKIRSTSASMEDIYPSTRLLIQQTTGNVGIGTSTPTQKLEVAGKIKSFNDENVSKQVVSYDDPITTTSIYSGKTLKIHALKNVFSGLSRFTRTDTITGSTRKTTWKIKPEYSNITYPEGEIYFSSWYGQGPDSIRVRVRNESGVWYGPFTTTQNLSQNAPFGYYKVPISNNSNYTREIEITSVYASTVYDYQELNYNLKTSEGFTDNTFVSSSGGNIYGNINVVGNIKAVIPSYASTAAAAGDTNLSSGSFFKVTNGNGTSALHIKD